MSKTLLIEVAKASGNSENPRLPYEVIPGLLVNEVVADLKRRFGINSRFGIFALCAVEQGGRVLDPCEELFFNVREAEAMICVLLPFESTLSQARPQTQKPESKG